MRWPLVLLLICLVVAAHAKGGKKKKSKKYDLASNKDKKTWNVKTKDSPQLSSTKKSSKKDYGNKKSMKKKYEDKKLKEKKYEDKKPKEKKYVDKKPKEKKYVDKKLKEKKSVDKKSKEKKYEDKKSKEKKYEDKKSKEKKYEDKKSKEKKYEDKKSKEKNSKKQKYEDKKSKQKDYGEETSKKDYGDKKSLKKDDKNMNLYEDKPSPEKNDQNKETLDIKKNYKDKKSPKKNYGDKKSEQKNYGNKKPLKKKDKDRKSPKKNDKDRKSPKKNDKDRKFPKKSDKDKKSQKKSDKDRKSPKKNDKDRKSPKKDDKDRKSPKKNDKEKYSKKKDKEKKKYTKDNKKKKIKKDYKKSNKKDRKEKRNKKSNKKDSKEKRNTKKEDQNGYVGCYRDSRRRILSLAGRRDGKMTVEKCIKFCADKKAKFAGVEFFSLCYCGNRIRSNRKAKETQCRLPCSGNRKQKCGGIWRISVYNVLNQANDEPQPVCHKLAKMRNGKCVCKRGFAGDGITSCHRSCVCMASGDPHYKTYDGEMIHFMGTCKYLLTKSTEGGNCSFSVEVKNERRGRNMKVSYTRTVDFKIYGKFVRLAQGGKVLIDGEKKYLPVKEMNGQLKVFKSGRFTQVWTECGIAVNFDGKHAVMVTTPPRFKKKLEGICGDCNGKKDDLKTKEGVDVSKQRNKYALIGDSYSVFDDSADERTRCETEDIPVECESKMNNLVNEPDVCGDLNSINGRFGACVKAIPQTARDYYRSCVMDMCSYEGETNLLHRVKCNSLESFVEECAENGIKINWRTRKFCPLECKGPNMVYMASGPGCPATCLDPLAPSTCNLDNKEGCFCKRGFVLSDDKCIKQEKCGCKDSNGDYYPLGSKKNSQDCAAEFVCRVIGKKANFVKESTGLRCHRNADCRFDVDGIRSCQCKKGYIGDGYKRCTELCGLKYNCHADAKCVKGKCVCNKGLYGDGVNSCEEKCICSTTGRQYKTFDEEIFSFLGTCQYKLFEADKRKCNIKVLSQNSKQSSIEHVDIEFEGTKIRLSKDNKLFVNEELRYLPYNQASNISVTLSGGLMRVATRCGVSVFWDGISKARIIIPRSMGSEGSGLCGNCNGRKDDLKTNGGIDVSQQADRFTLLGDSYSIDGSCKSTEVPECENIDREAMKYCDILKRANSPFSECIQAMRGKANSFYKSCQESACSVKTDTCEVLSMFADECRAGGFNVRWRALDLCPIQCKENMVYSANVNGCPATCAEPEGTGKCTEESTEGCQCIPGYVLSDGECVPLSDCGCVKDGSYYPLNTTVLSEDCTTSKRCISMNGEAIFVTVAINLRCHPNGMCGLDNGVRKCVCMDGFSGDGIRYCNEDTSTPFSPTSTPGPKTSTESELILDETEDVVTTTPNSPPCDHPEPDCSVIVRHDSCGTVTMVTGNCAFSNQFNTGCQYMVTTGVNSRGDFSAAIKLGDRKLSLSSPGDVVKDCATFTLQGAILVINENVCEMCALQFIRNLLPRNQCA